MNIKYDAARLLLVFDLMTTSAVALEGAFAAAQSHLLDLMVLAFATALEEVLSAISSSAPSPQIPSATKEEPVAVQSRPSLAPRASSRI